MTGQASFRAALTDPEAPIPPGDPVEMTQAINDNLEGWVRRHMDQWFWIHRRWKPERKRAVPTKS